MNVSSYNLKRHIELLNREKKLLSQDKYLIHENRAEFLELIEYGAAVESHILWEDRFEVASLIQTFLNKEINAMEFHDSVFGLRNTHHYKRDEFLSKLVSEEIKGFFPNQKSYKVAGFLSYLYSECDYFEMDWDKETLYNSIRNQCLDFQKTLNEE